MHAGRRKPDDDVAGHDPRAVDHVVPRDGADARAREVELALRVDVGQLGRLAADQRDAGGTADLGRALDELDHLLGVDAVGGDVVEEHERLGAAGDHVVDAVGGEIGAAGAERATLPREHELRPDGVRRGREQPVVVERVEGCEAAETRSRPSTRRPLADARRPLHRVRSRRRRPRTTARSQGECSAGVAI